MSVVPFNGPWFGFLGVMALIGLALHFLLRRRPPLLRRRVLAAVAAANVVLYTTFTFNSILDPNVPEVVLLQNLPFHLCNLVAWGLIPAYLFDWGRPTAWLRAFCFYPGVLSGLLTLTSPVPVYIGHPVFSLPSIGFYGVHSMNAILGVLLATLGLYTPRYRDAFRAVGHLLLLATAILPLDLAFRAWLDPNANYFYLFNPEGAAILIALHNLVPIPYVYMVLLTPVALGGCLLLGVIYKALSRLLGHAVAEPVAAPA
ncbi:MAG: YwaF family protein [Propionibacteriaceae bacterium]|nr:YwaF family protein [Propionibacteriaceae bacterium]